jgi:hypothetical protein
MSALQVKYAPYRCEERFDPVVRLHSVYRSGVAAPTDDRLQSDPSREVLSLVPGRHFF